jgi:hypothetical protein
MRCANCGFPLSPTRTHCPRCGAAAGKSEARSPDQVSVSQQPAFMQQGRFSAAKGALDGEILSQRWDAAPWNAQGDALAPQITPPAYTQANSAASDQALFLGANGAVMLSQQGPQSEQANQVWPGQLAADATIAAAPAPGSFPYLPRGSSGIRSMRFGFKLAGLLVGIGGVLLLLIAIMAPGLAAPTSPVKVAVAQHAATFVPSPPPASTPVLSPTPTYPAQQYVDTVQLASAVNTRTAQPMTTATTFKVKQQIFVTFMVHPGGHAGAVCLRWFLNNQYYSHYEFSVAATTQPAYSYTFAGIPGPGYVQIYWASTVACTDRLLAQQANFMVTT